MNIFLDALKGRKFITRDGTLLTVVDVDLIGPGVATINLVDKDNKCYFYDSDKNGRCYFDMECSMDIVKFWG